MGKAAKQTRENRTITVDFRDEATYFQLLGNGKAFLECVLAFMLSLGWHCQVVGDDIVTRQQKALSGRDFYRPDA
jgi:hypothetical protein